jgi:glycosyltransferase involved in cell wall biosynthesis
MKVSIIVPAHNEEKLIGKTLSSLYQILKESGLNYEIIAVDNNSTDKTLEL